MDDTDTNKLYDLVGSFVGLADDDDMYIRFRDFDPEDEDELLKVIDEFLMHCYLSLEPRRRKDGLAVLSRLASGSRDEQEREWESMLPPFSYPNTINLFELIYKKLTSSGVT